MVVRPVDRFEPVRPTGLAVFVGRPGAGRRIVVACASKQAFVAVNLGPVDTQSHRHAIRIAFVNPLARQVPLQDTRADVSASVADEPIVSEHLPDVTSVGDCDERRPDGGGGLGDESVQVLVLGASVREQQRLVVWAVLVGDAEGGGERSDAT